MLDGVRGRAEARQPTRPVELRAERDGRHAPLPRRVALHPVSQAEARGRCDLVGRLLRPAGTTVRLTLRVPAVLPALPALPVVPRPGHRVAAATDAAEPEAVRRASHQ